MLYLKFTNYENEISPTALKKLKILLP